MIDRLLCLVAVSCLLSSFPFLQTADASCNVVPDARVVTMRGPNPVIAVQNLRAKLTADPSIGVKGALGGIDRHIVDPTSSAGLRVWSDGICVNVGGDDGASTRPEMATLEPENAFVVLLLDRRDSSPVAGVVFASRDLCTPLETTQDDSVEHALGRLRCTNEGATIAKRPQGGIEAHVEPELLQQLVGSSDDQNAVAAGGSLTVIVGRQPGGGAELRQMLRSVLDRGCKAACPDLKAAGGQVCIQKLYALAGSGRYHSDPLLCDVNVPTTPVFNDFGKQCDETDPFSSTAGLAACGHQPTELILWDDSCGGVHVPFDWSGIRRDDVGSDTKANGDPLVREVAGRSAIGLKEKGDDLPVWIPGREFLGSTPKDDENGYLATTDWRFPDIDVWYLPGSPQEMGAEGTVEEDFSVLHFYPRMPVGVFCDNPGGGNEACMAVEGRYRGQGIECACRDRYAVTCSCTTVDLDDRKYFACSDPALVPTHAAQPCTRHSHCNPTGKCDMKPFCVKKGSVWHAGAAWPMNPEECWTDADCTGANKQCGFLLFNLDEIKQDDGKLSAKLDFLSSTPRVRRGVCQGDRKEVCKNNPSNKKECLAGVAPCRGYQLRVGGQL